MEKEIIYNSNLHFEHRQWQSELAFWEDELQTFENRLSELVTRWTAKDVLVKLEHYQNQFIMHGGVIEDLQEAIEQHETRIAAQSQTGSEALDIIMTKIHLDLRSKMETQRRIYADLKADFFQFLTKYM